MGTIYFTMSLSNNNRLWEMRPWIKHYRLSDITAEHMALKDGSLNGVSVTASECKTSSFITLGCTAGTEQYTVDCVASNLRVG